MEDGGIEEGRERDCRAADGRRKGREGGKMRKGSFLLRNITPSLPSYIGMSAHCPCLMK